MGEIQNVTNPMITLVRNKEGKKLDNIREDYVSLMEEAEKLEAKGKAAKADKKRQLAAGAEAKYAEVAKSMGLQADLKATLVRESAPLVKPGVVLTKSQKKEIKDIEKELKDLRKTLDKYTNEQLYEIKTEGTTNLSQKKIDRAKEAIRMEEQLAQHYANKCAEYGIPSQKDIIKKLYSIEDPVKAKELRKQIKEELKAANMWFGYTEDYVKSDNFKAISEGREVDNQLIAHERNGYAAVRKSVHKAIGEKDGAEVIRMLDGVDGSDGVFNIGLEKAAAKYAINVEKYTEDFIAQNKTKTFSEVDTIELSTGTIKTADIQRVTLLSGETLTQGQFNDIPLGLVRGVETDISANESLSFGAIVKEKGDDGYVSRTKSLKAAKDLGFKTEKVNVAKAALDAVGMGALAATPTIIDPFKVDFHYKDSLTVSSESVIDSPEINAFIDDIKKQLESDFGVFTDIEGAYGFKYTEIIDVEHTHWCVAPAVVAAATAFFSNLADQVINGNEKDATLEAYRAAREKLNLELIHNARGADGQSKLNPKELANAEADAIIALDKAIETVAKKIEAKKAEAPKELQVETRETKAKLEQDAKYCTYEYKSGEYWSGIVANVYKDENGKPISGSDLTELWQEIKYNVNKFGKNEAGMPKVDKKDLKEGESQYQVKMLRSYTCKSGKTYTYNCDDKNVDRDISNEQDPKGRSTSARKTTVDMTNGFQAKWSNPTFGYTITENGTVIYDSGNYEGSRVAAGKADLQNDKKYYEEKGYIFK